MLKLLFISEICFFYRLPILSLIVDDTFSNCQGFFIDPLLALKKLFLVLLTLSQTRPSHVSIYVDHLFLLKRSISPKDKNNTERRIVFSPSIFKKYDPMKFEDKATREPQR